MRIVESCLSLALTALVIAGCGSDDNSAPSGNGPGETIVIGAKGSLGGAEVRSWAVLDSSGIIRKIGATVPRAAIEGVSSMAVLQLDFPDQVKATTFLDHLSFDYMPDGHGPPAYMAPHFDMHFYGIDTATQNAVDCVDEPMPDADRIPQPYIIPGTGVEPNGTCVPQMGVHAIDPTSPELASESPAPFTKTFILGYHNGALAFVEPMITKDYLEQEVTFQVDVPTPQTLGRSTLWPTKMNVDWDAATQSYEIAFSALVPAQ